MAERCNELRASDIRCPRFTLAEEERYAKIVSVFDGDTARANLFLRPGDPAPIQMSIRFVGYDAPEMRSPIDEERRRAEQTREVVRQLCMGRIVRLEMQGLDKYGRVLARVFVGLPEGGELCVNDWVLQHGLGVPYDGRKRGEMIGGGAVGGDLPATVDVA